MKTISIHKITEEGLTLEIDNKQEWVVEILKNLFQGDSLDLTTLHGKIDLTNTNRVISCVGFIGFSHHPLCARCGKELTINESIKFQETLAPMTDERAKSLKDKEKRDEIELSPEDLEFSFYTNDEIHLDPIVNDEIALTIPYNYYCDRKVPCKPELPTDPHISFNEGGDPRWAPLKDLKIEKK